MLEGSLEPFCWSPEGRALLIPVWLLPTSPSGQCTAQCMMCGRVGLADYAHFGKSYDMYYDPASMMSCKWWKSNGPHVLGHAIELGGTGLAWLARSPQE